MGRMRAVHARERKRERERERDSEGGRRERGRERERSRDIALVSARGEVALERSQLRKTWRKRRDVER